MITLKQVELSDAALIFDAWGSHSENFTYLTARVFADVDDAERYLVKLFPTPQSMAFHILDSAGTVVGIVKAPVVEHRAQVGYVVDAPHWGRGLATAAVQEIVARLESVPEVARIWATCALDNPVRSVSSRNAASSARAFLGTGPATLRKTVAFSTTSPA